MQGPPPTSPSYNMAPPIKKQRGGPGDTSGPPVQDAAAQRRAQLQNLRAGYANRPNMGPPPPGRGTIPNIGFNPGAAPPNKQPVLQPNGGNAAAPINNNSSQQSTAGGAHRPAVPQRAPNFARESDIFPSAPKAETPAVARRLDVAFQEPSPQATAVEAAPASAPPLVAEHPPPTTPAAPKVSFAAATSPTTPASVSSPEPIRSPPQAATPFPGAAASNGTRQVHAGHTPFPGKAVATASTPTEESPVTHKAVQFAQQTPHAKAPEQPFAGQTPHPKAQQQQSLAGHTPHPKVQQQQASAGHTPHPKAQQQEQQPFAGHTPHPKAAAQEVPTTNRRQKLAQMREVADTPPKPSTSSTNRTTVVSFASQGPEEEEKEESVELRMQRQMAEEIKKNEQLNRKVAELEEKLAHQATQTAAKVSFMPPASPGRSLTPIDRLTSPSKRRAATPHPKREQSDVEELDMVFLEQATEDLPYKFEASSDDGDDEDFVSAVFIVRRPYGFGDMDQELWFVAGEKSAKLYKRDASVDHVESIEVAVEIGADESKLLLFNEADVRHQNAVEGTWNNYGNVYERGEALGTVAYIDADANEKEYSLDKLVEQAIDVRNHYCASLRNMAVGLQRRAQEGGGAVTPRSTGPPIASPGGEDLQHSPSSVPKADACVGTDEMKFPPAQKSVPKDGTGAPPAKPDAAPPAPPAAPHEPHSDVFSVLIGMFLSILYSIFKLPFVVIYTLITWVLVVICGFGIYLLMLNTMEMTGVAPPLHYYHNPPGIM